MGCITTCQQSNCIVSRRTEDVSLQNDEKQNKNGDQFQQRFRHSTLEAFQSLKAKIEELQIGENIKKRIEKELNIKFDEFDAVERLKILFEEKKQFLEEKAKNFQESIQQISLAVQKIKQNQHTLKGSTSIGNIVLANFYNNIGNSLRYLERNIEAIQFFQKAITINNQNSLFYVNCALTLAHPEIQNFKRAYDYLTKGQQLLLKEEGQCNSYVLQRIKIFRSDIKEWQFKKKHNYTTPQEKDRLKSKLKKFQTSISHLFKADLQESIGLYTESKEGIDMRLEKIAQQWRKTEFDIDSLLTIDEEIFYLYKNNPSDFSVVPFHIVAYCIRNWKNGLKFKDLDEKISTALAQMQLRYPASKGSEQIKSTFSSFSLPKEERPDMFQNNFFKTYENLMSQILKVSEKAKQVFPQFEKFTKQICLTKGHCYKSGLKFPENIEQQVQSKIMIRVTEKLFKELTDKKAQIFNSLDQQFVDSQKITISLLTQKFFKVWKCQIEKILQDRLNNKEKTSCYIFDLIRCKCMYRNISELQQIASLIIEQSAEKGYSLIEIDNRIQKNTRDIVIKVNLNGIGVQIQLALQFDSNLNQFSHSVYEIQRSPGGCLFGAVIWMGKIKKIMFIRDIQRLLKDINDAQEEQCNYLIERKLDLQFILNEVKSLNE